MEYIIGRILLGSYIGIALMLLLYSLSNSVFKKNGWRAAIGIISWIIIWPLALFSPAGRKTLTNQIKQL